VYEKKRADAMEFSTKGKKGKRGGNEGLVPGCRPRRSKFGRRKKSVFAGSVEGGKWP